MSSKLAVNGGPPVRTAPFTAWPQYSENDFARLREVLESRNWGGFPFPNRLAREFAAAFAEYHGAKYGLAVMNGTVALQIALRAAGLRFGDEVIVPAYTWEGTAAAVLFEGGVPVFVDVREDTFCLDASQVEEAITDRTRALLPVHLAMRFADMDALAAIARKYNLALIEDCAHAHGGRWKGRGAGSMGDAGCFSLQSSKLMTAGEGGVVITSDLRCFEYAQSYVNCGRASETDRHDIRIVGSNFRMTELQAALLAGQLERLEEQNLRRAQNARRLAAGLARIPHVAALPPDPGITREAMYQFVFRLLTRETPVSRDVFVRALEAEGVPCEGRFYEAVYRSDLFPAAAEQFPALAAGRAQPVDYSRTRCPVAERLAYEESVWLPHFLLLGGESDVDDILTAVEKVATRLGELEGLDAGVKGVSRTGRSKLQAARQW
ncbi:MAG: DegT/DnrJ/EryC1/StrS family aminotransferase [Bryobacteraceae bacterium]|nr:DegT/DnrJ/EryC1/StrS family aminotransferase [Bryobacteraceae bacterium]